MEAAPETVALHRAIWQQDYDKVVQILGQEDVKPDAPHGMVSTLGKLVRYTFCSLFVVIFNPIHS